MRSENRLEQMREYSKNYRSIARANSIDERELHKIAKQQRKDALKADRLAKSLLLKKERSERKSNARKLRYANSKPNDWVDGRALRKLNSAPKIVKPKKIKIDKVKPIEPQLANRIIDTSLLVKLQLDAKTIIFIRPDQDAELIKQKFLSRSKF